MAARSPKFADSPDLDQSIQIALDAAEASMDVTAEFERISAQFEQTVSAAQRLEKMSRIALMVGGGVAVFAVLLMGMIWQRSSSGLERLSATNTELLTILAENVSTMDEKLAPIVAIDSQMAQLRGELTSLNESVSAVAQALDDTSAFKADLTAMTEMLSALDTLENAQMRSDAVQQEIGDRIATLNGVGCECVHRHARYICGTIRCFRGNDHQHVAGCRCNWQQCERRRICQNQRTDGNASARDRAAGQQTTGGILCGHWDAVSIQTRP